jgi:hypothetical protein
MNHHENACPILSAVLFGAKGGKPRQRASGSVDHHRCRSNNSNARAGAFLVACRGEFVSIQPSWVPQVREANLGLFAHTLDDRPGMD